MSEYSILEDPPSELWESVLNGLPEGNLWQTIEYGEASRIAFPSTHVVRLMAVDKDEPVGIVQGAYSKYFGFGTCVSVHCGPVAKDSSEELDVVKSLLLALEVYGSRNKVISAQVWWPYDWGMHEVFHELGYVPTRKFNAYMVNLDRTADELWESIDSNKRKNIRKAMREGVEVVQTLRYDDVFVFYEMLENSGRTHGFTPPSFSWFDCIWKTFSPGGAVMIFLAKYKGKVVSAVFVTVHGKTAYALGAGSFSESWKVRPNDLLHWRVMEWACNHGFSRYYMGLVDDPIPTEESKAWGIWRWKREWKGDLDVIQIFDKLYLPKYRHILTAKKMVEQGYYGVQKLTSWKRMGK